MTQGDLFETKPLSQVRTDDNQNGLPKGGSRMAWLDYFWVRWLMLMDWIGAPAGDRVEDEP